ncbi:MAG TPA: cytidylate kinase-like family protein [Dehalococcoidia bacterium]|nr:cytidylate kinase-like family protein [Dehalococcoidia bacterium]
MPVVTMSGNIASGAREVGQAAAQALGVDFVDQQLLVEAASRCGVPVGAMAQRDERCEGFRERLASLLRNFLERSIASGADPLAGAMGLEVLLSRTYADMAAEREQPELTDAIYMKTMTAIVSELGARGNIVILGRGSQMILAGQPGVLHVLCVAPQPLRIERLAEREGISPEEAARRTADSDRARAAFHRKFWRVEVDNPALYDLAVNTAKLSFDQAAELVVQAARAKATAAA